ncbi:uncharacterized protein LOC143044432 [Mytilus galloprovincialis]|uniref:uncharacterized protein LOC143044432 n=1 Tax=Mytilus galloprovincialis TaxID=29158 RepID=UPI003F7C1D37
MMKKTHILKPMTSNPCHLTLRTWMQNIASSILKQYTGQETHSKSKTMWKEKPEHWPLNKPFYDTKNKSQDNHGKTISDEDLLKCLLDCCKHKNVQINFLYQKEVAAWQENRRELLYKLYIFRMNMEKIKISVKNMISYMDSEEIKTGLQNINVSLSSETDITSSRCKGQSEIITEITRNLATILCKIIKGKDPEAKCDGIWKSPPENWPPAVPFYSPHNRGKGKQTGSDQKLVLTLIQNPKAVIPQKYQSLVATFQQAVNANNAKEAKKHKETLCRIYTIQNNILIIDNALKNMHEHGLFTLNIHSILNQWWTTQTLDSQSDEILKNSAIISNNRLQAVQIHITETSFKIGFKANDLEENTKSHIFYNITSPTQKSCPQTICSSSSTSSATNEHNLETLNNDSEFPSCSKHSDFEHCKDQAILTKEQSKNSQTQESRQHLSENFESSKQEPVITIENDDISLNSKQTRGKKRKHPKDEELQSEIKRPTLSTDNDCNTQTDEISEMQQSEQPSIRQDNIELQDSEKWLFTNLGITDADLSTSISTFSQEVNLNILSGADYCNLSDQLEVLLTDMVGYESGKNSNTEELLSRGHDKSE